MEFPNYVLGSTDFFVFPGSRQKALNISLSCCIGFFFAHSICSSLEVVGFTCAKYTSVYFYLPSFFEISAIISCFCLFFNISACFLYYMGCFIIPLYKNFFKVSMLSSCITTKSFNTVFTSSSILVLWFSSLLPSIIPMFVPFTSNSDNFDVLSSFIVFI